MVIIDVRPTVEGIPTQAYISKEIVKEGKETRRTFQHLACSIGASEPEEVRYGVTAIVPLAFLDGAFISCLIVMVYRLVLSIS